MNTPNLSSPATIKAPIRMYVTKNQDGTATLNYNQPSTAFAPYMDEAGPDLVRMAAELGAIFAAISVQATQ